MKLVSAKTKNEIVDYVRDAVAMAVSGTLTYGLLGEVGGVISVFVAPKIAGTQGGKTFNKYLALLMTIDKFMERFNPRGVM